MPRALAVPGYGPLSAWVGVEAADPTGLAGAAVWPGRRCSFLSPIIRILLNLLHLFLESPQMAPAGPLGGGQLQRLDLPGASQVTVPQAAGSLAHLSEPQDHAGEVPGSPKSRFTDEQLLLPSWAETHSHILAGFCPLQRANSGSSTRCDFGANQISFLGTSPPPHPLTKPCAP